MGYNETIINKKDIIMRFFGKKKTQTYVELALKKKPIDSHEESAECTHWDPDTISSIVKDHMAHAAVVFVGVAAALTVLHTLSQIAINASKPTER